MRPVNVLPDFCVLDNDFLLDLEVDIVACDFHLPDMCFESYNWIVNLMYAISTRHSQFML